MIIKKVLLGFSMSYVPHASSKTIQEHPRSIDLILFCDSWLVLRLTIFYITEALVI